MGYYMNLLLVKSENKLFEIAKKIENDNFCLLFMGQFIGNLRNSAENFLVKSNAIYEKFLELSQRSFLKVL